MRTILKIIFFLALIATFSTLFFLPISNQTPEVEQTKIVTTIFPAYDFARTISKDTNTEIKMLIKPGADLHSYEPTPQDIIAIKESNIFIYNGGESESWINSILNEIDKDNTVIVRMMDSVELKEESLDNILNAKSNDIKTETDYDEHVWTNPNNVIKISEAIAQAIKNHAPDNTSTIQRNLDQFKTDLEKLDESFRSLASQKTGTIIIADRFPFLYFTNEYGFNYLAAFPGCSEQTEASAKTVAELIKATKDSSNKIIFKLELSNGKIAQTVSKSTKATVLTWHSVHNLSQADFDAGKTYLDFMQENLKNLGEALHDRTSD
ncbi:zinc ABC transporter substrate-binding protein [Candidatus Saccharibacteria bacterium]|nr:zinc ABC transporter substrate-binding protein [Candidatus Saccharibacteria bacterium]